MIAIFDIKRDNNLIAGGTHLWCETHGTAQPLESQSPDPRYCQDCFDYLMTYEVPLLPLKKRPKWIPRFAKIGGENQYRVSGVLSGNMHTVNGVNIQSVHNSTEDPPTKPFSKRGPKSRELPDDLISQWAGEGLGSKAISSRLKREQGVDVHYSTIQRRLQGVLV
ncbi:hypothetical protein ACFLYE_00240 [Chloroflexota bacterium]